MTVDLSKYDNSWFSTPGNKVERLLWFLVNVLFFNNSLSALNGPKVVLLRLFGASVGSGVVIKPSVNIKYPRNLRLGDNTWIGEGVWIDNLARVDVGSNCCISQDVYICTGNHDWSDPTFGLVVRGVVIDDGAWVGARCVLLPGAHVGVESVISAGSVFSGVSSPRGVYVGNPAKFSKERTFSKKIE